MDHVVGIGAMGLRRYGATFPKSWHGAASIVDLEKALRAAVVKGWPVLSGKVQPVYGTTIKFGVRYCTDFTRVVGVLSKAVRNDLDQHDKAEIAA
jgi:hypothetical protein